jgi:hypothetical protein
MADRGYGSEDVFEGLVAAGVVSTSNGWILKACVQRNPKLTLELACSTTMVYDAADRLLLQITDLN